MIKYAILKDKSIGLCDVGLGDNAEFYKSIGMVQLDVEQSDIDGCWYLSDAISSEEHKIKLSEFNKQKQIEDIKKQLEEIDLKSIRALRANEEDYLKKLENRAIELREKMNSL